MDLQGASGIERFVRRLDLKISVGKIQMSLLESKRFERKPFAKVNSGIVAMGCPILFYSGIALERQLVGGNLTLFNSFDTNFSYFTLLTRRHRSFLRNWALENISFQ